MDDARRLLEDEAAASSALALHRLAREVKDLRRQNKAALRELDLAQERLELALAIAPPAAAPRLRAPRKRKGKRRAAAVLCCSDWHVEETVHPRQLGGYANTYNPQIAEERAASLFRRAASMVRHHQAGMFDLRSAVVWLGGDFISGYLREEDQATNALSPTEAILLFQRLAISGLRYLLEHAGLESLHVVCNHGNHGRTTEKIRHRDGAQNSYEWLAYHTIAQAFAGDKRVQWTIADGAHAYVDVLGHTIRTHHGDAIRYAGGVLGLGVPAGKRIAAWDRVRAADLTLLGHFHQLGVYPRLVTNGSLIGFNAYALSIGAKPEPPQQAFFLVDEAKGPCMHTPIWCG